MTTEFSYEQLSFLQIVDTAVLAAIAQGRININQLVWDELANRGMDKNGKWIGFDAAKALYATAA